MNMPMLKTTRPSPSESATLFSPGTQRIGNDGNTWQVSQLSSGVKRWVKVTGSPGAWKTLPTKNSLFNFTAGQKVIIDRSGFGAHPNTIGKIVTIKELVQQGAHPFYTVEEKFRTPLGDSLIGMCREETFKPLTIKSKPIPKIDMSKILSKAVIKKTTQENRSIETSLINKEEVFRMLALAEATGLPLLLVGEPGVAKTKTIIEYAKAWLNKDGKMTASDFAEKIYILETDEGTKASEIKGMPDLGKLFTENKYEVQAAIADADIVIINEVDKAGSAIRNAMLGVMNEKFLFNGKHKIPCKWKLFVATCNEIPKDEVKSPFWDRFMLKMTVNRVSAGEISKYYAKGARDYRERFSIGVPNQAELDQLEIPVKKLDKYLEVGYQSSSDRTLTFVPKLTKAVAYVWDISIDKALVKTAQIMISQAAGSELQNKLMSPEVKAVMSKVEMLQSYSTNEQLEAAVTEIEGAINSYAARGVMDKGQVQEIELSITYILENHPARKVTEFDENEFDVDEAAPMTATADVVDFQ